MKNMSAILTTAALLGATLVPAPAAPATTTVSGKIVDLVTYMMNDHAIAGHMSGDHAMAGGAMSGDHAMAGGAMSGDHAMAGGAMSGDHAMAGGAMSGDHAMAGGAMSGDHAMAASCPVLGLVTSAGKVYTLGTHADEATAAALCKKLNDRAVVTGMIYAQGGSSVFLVNSVK